MSGDLIQRGTFIAQFWRDDLCWSTKIEVRMNGPWSRRRFIKLAGAQAIASGVLGLPSVSASSSSNVRRVIVMSDIHIGKYSRGLDGAEWLARAYSELDRNNELMDYGLTLGDITHHGDCHGLQKYLKLRDKSQIPKWFELAGNHEYRRENIKYYRQLVRNPAPYSIVDGNIVWLLVSDENDLAPGNISTHSLRWLEKKLVQHQDKIVILCTHQIPSNTVRRSNEGKFCLQPRKAVSRILSYPQIALSLFGHEHHSPYTNENKARKNGTTFINAASVSHAYGTEASGSLVLELRQGDTKIIARRRNHDRQIFQQEFDAIIPLHTDIKFAHSPLKYQG